VYHFHVRLSPVAHSLFPRGCYTRVDAAIRRELITHPFAQWLHLYYASHESPMPMPVARLREWTRHTSPMPEYRRLLCDALGRLREVAQHHGATYRPRVDNGHELGWINEDDRVVVCRS
jgi:hypothetical protein